VGRAIVGRLTAPRGDPRSSPPTNRRSSSSAPRLSQRAPRSTRRPSANPGSGPTPDRRLVPAPEMHDERARRSRVLPFDELGSDAAAPVHSTGAAVRWAGSRTHQTPGSCPFRASGARLAGRSPTGGSSSAPDDRRVRCPSPSRTQAEADRWVRPAGVFVSHAETLHSLRARARRGPVHLRIGASRCELPSPPLAARASGRRRRWGTAAHATASVATGPGSPRPRRTSCR
jgi:hypothetical protein